MHGSWFFLWGTESFLLMLKEYIETGLLLGPFPFSFSSQCILKYWVPTRLILKESSRYYINAPLIMLCAISLYEMFFFFLDNSIVTTRRERGGGGWWWWVRLNLGCRGKTRKCQPIELLGSWLTLQNYCQDWIKDRA